MTQGLRDRLRGLADNTLVAQSSLVLVTTVLMAGAGAVFWLLAARLGSPEDVGLAGSLAATADALAMIAQVGLNIAIVKVLPTSGHKAADILTAATVVIGAGLLLALTYSLLLPVTAPRLQDVVHSPLAIALYTVMVGATALNVLTDNVFMALGRAWDYLRLNGVVMGLLKCTLPFALAGAGALGLYSSLGLAVLVCSVLSLATIMRRVPGPRRIRPSRELLASRNFAGAAYIGYMLSILPNLLLPLVVINSLGATEAGSYFISYQVGSLLLAAILAIANAIYAHSERVTEGRHRVVRQGGLLLVGVAFIGALMLVALAPYLLQLFGDHYAHEATGTLRALALSLLAGAIFAWVTIGLRLSRNLRAIIGVQLVATGVTLGMALATSSRGTEWVAASIGVGCLAGALVGCLGLRTFAKFSDTDPVITPSRAVTVP